MKVQTIICKSLASVSATEVLMNVFTKKNSTGPPKLSLNSITIRNGVKNVQKDPQQRRYGPQT